MECQFLLIWILYLPQVTTSTAQDCLSKRQALSSLHQIQKLLSGQEASYLQSLRTMKKKISLLQNTITRQVSKLNETCPKLEVPNNGRKLGSISAVGHEVHFLCEKGFELVGSETRVCQESHSWSGQQPFCRNINECAKSPCLNGGTCVDDVNRFACMCARGWSGTYCQNSVYSYWTSQTNSSFSRQPHCANMQGSTQCTCDEGFQIAGRDNSRCQDLDECELYYSGRLPRLCAHACVNTPGSYRCTCPPGYSLRGDQRNCKDLDECASRQHNCSRDELCVNTFGGFQCVRPDCPRARQNTSYVKTSLLRCERNPCPVDNKACAQAASSISFSYLSLVSNLSVPRVLFRMSAARVHGDSLRFGLLGGRGRGHFSVQRSDRLTGELVLVSPVLGPAVLEAELEMTELEKRTVLARFISKVTVFISQYDF
ncbi:Fibulin-7 [Acipenser ruthenus]|uniref:Fibulin-7 n=1 Tax=Acipenser ruthenus TaxID=7906 RepID=A0A444U7R8_ACIRT|nr:Fibulin-7 [Acipenser ruthenus]